MQLHVRMTPRDPTEPHRVATPLELFLDLAFVVAIAQAAAGLHHGLVDGHVGDALIGFPAVFFAIWWAWMNFAWFGSAYDCDDALYRLAVFVQMTGVLVMAAGIPRAFDDRDLVVMTIGYVDHAVGPGRTVAAGCALGPVEASHRACATPSASPSSRSAWLLRLLLPESWFAPAFLVLVAAELAVPVWAEAAGRTPWHPHHIVERYGLFTIIVLGESVLGATLAVQAALDADSTFVDLAAVVGGGLLLVFSMWWIYFDLPSERMVDQARREFEMGGAVAFEWGYGHYVVFGSVAAAGAGLAVSIDQVTGHSTLSDAQAGWPPPCPWRSTS